MSDLNPLGELIPLSRKRRRTIRSDGARGGKTLVKNLEDPGASIGSTGSWTVSAASAALVLAQSHRDCAPRTSIFPDGLNMGPAIVGRLSRYSGGATPSGTPVLSLSMLMGSTMSNTTMERRSVSLYRDFDNGVEGSCCLKGVFFLPVSMVHRPHQCTTSIQWGAAR